MSLVRRLQYEAAGRLVGPMLERTTRLRAMLRKRKRKHKAGPPQLQSTRKLKELLTTHYLAGRYADGAVPVAWVTSGFPVEILRPFGFHVVYPENHAALCAVQREGVKLAEVAEQWGMPRDTCAYARCDIGSTLAQLTPVGRIPRPDVLLACTNICQTVVYWYRTLAAMLNVPLFVIDTPFQYGEPDEHAERFVAQQIEEAIALCERISGIPRNDEALGVAAREAKEASVLWGECLGFAKHKPAPWSGFDQFIHIGPIVTLRGMPECTAYYRMLRDELAERTRRGIAVVENEKHRLVWDNLPVWYELREMSKLLASEGFNIVVTTYTNGWAETAPMFDEHDPIGSAARVYSRVFINRGMGHRASLLRSLAKDWGCDGVLLHSNRSCKPYSVGQLDLAAQLSRDGLRTLVLDGDHLDSRSYSKEQAEGRLSAFMESFQ